MKTIIAVSFALFLVAVFGGCQSVSLRSDQEQIRQSLLREKPLGTSIKEIEAWVNAKGWKHVKVSHTRGFFKNALLSKDWTTIGVKSITATIGEYVSFPVGFTTMVQANWGFNEKGELIDVWVNKSADAP